MSKVDPSEKSLAPPHTVIDISSRSDSCHESDFRDSVFDGMYDKT